MTLFVITIIGFLSGIIGTGLGGAIAIICRNPGRNLLACILGFAAGIMFSIVAFDLLPVSFSTGGFPLGVFGFLLGMAAFSLAEALFLNVLLPPTGNNRAHYVRTGILVGLAIAIHDLAEGLAIGSGYMVTRSLGFRIALIMMVHNIPEGMAVAGPLRAGRLEARKAIIVTALAGAPTGFGALAGGILGNVSPQILALCLSFAGGAMISVASRQLIPDARRITLGPWATVGIIVGVIMGLALVIAI